MERKFNMSDKKLFDIHIEIGNEAGFFYARTVMGNSLEFKNSGQSDAFNAISMVLNALITNGIFTSLTRDPSMSSYPIPTHTHALPTTNVTPAGSHSHSHVIPVMGYHPIYELHFEIGSDTGVHGGYAKTQFMKPFIEYRKFRNGFAEDAANDLLLELEDQGVLLQLMNDPKMSTFPFLSPPSSVSTQPIITSTQKAAKKKDVKRKLPSECIGYADIECRDHCTSWDFFGQSKCGNMCEWRKKL